MFHKLIPPLTESAEFEAEYLANTLRARRDFTWAQRAAIVAALTSTAPDSRSAAAQTPDTKLRSFALILARCESAATLLGWRKQIAPTQKRRLDAAIHRLHEAAAQVAVRASVQPAAPKPATRSPLFRVSSR